MSEESAKACIFKDIRARYSEMTVGISWREGGMFFLPADVFDAYDAEHLIFQHLIKLLQFQLKDVCKAFELLSPPVSPQGMD